MKLIMVDLKTAESATGLHEEPVPFDGHTYGARRNADEVRYQIFRDTELTPVGYVEIHRCEHSAGEWRLRVFGPDSEPIGLPSRHGEDHPGCVHSYVNALNHLRID